MHLDKKTEGIVTSVARQWWLKVNTKAVRLHMLDGATFPHIITVSYTVDGRPYTKRKWFWAHQTPPAVDSSVTVAYCESRPSKAKIL